MRIPLAVQLPRGAQVPWGSTALPGLGPLGIIGSDSCT